MEDDHAKFFIVQYHLTNVAYASHDSIKDNILWMMMQSTYMDQDLVLIGHGNCVNLTIKEQGIFFVC